MTRISDNIPAPAVILPAFACLSTVFQVMELKKILILIYLLCLMMYISSTVDITDVGAGHFS